MTIAKKVVQEIIKLAITGCSICENRPLLTSTLKGHKPLQGEEQITPLLDREGIKEK